MKTSIFDMTFVLPPLVEMTEVVKDNPISTDATGPCGIARRTHENIYLGYELCTAATGGDDGGGEGYANGNGNCVGYALPIY